MTFHLKTFSVRFYTCIIFAMPGHTLIHSRQQPYIVQGLLMHTKATKRAKISWFWASPLWWCLGLLRSVSIKYFAKFLLLRNSKSWNGHVKHLPLNCCCFSHWKRVIGNDKQMLVVMIVLMLSGWPWKRNQKEFWWGIFKEGLRRRIANETLEREF